MNHREHNGVFIAGPSALPINVTSLSISTDAQQRQRRITSICSATTCRPAPWLQLDAFDGTIWQIRDLGDGATPLSFTFPTPLQYKPPANTKACLLRSLRLGTVITTMNAVGFYGG